MELRRAVLTDLEDLSLWRRLFQVTDEAVRTWPL